MLSTFSVNLFEKRSRLVRDQAGAAMVENEFSDTLELVYEAGLDFKQWPAVLEQLAQLLGASATCLVKHNLPTSEGAMIMVRADPDIVQRYPEHYAKLNVVAQRAGKRPVQTCITDRAIL